MDYDILVVDDTESIRDLIAMYLEDFGYSFRKAEDPIRAIDILKTNTGLPKLIISDVDMPNMSGFEFVQYLKSIQKYVNIPVIFVSGHDNLEASSTGLDVGAVDYITKPFQSVDLLTRIANQIRTSEEMKRLRKLSQEREMFLKLICHDLSTPQTVLKHLLRKLDEDESKVTEFLPKLNKQLDQSIKIIQRVKYLLSETKKNDPSDMAMHNIRSLIEDSLALLEERLIEKEIVIKTDFHHTSEAYTNDISFVNSVAINILTNAIKFSPRASTITVSSTECSEFINLEFCDEGPGVPSNLLDSIQDSSQLESSLGSEGEKGTGYGLLLIFDSVKNLNGQIRAISSNTDKECISIGTKITVSLPKFKNKMKKVS